MIGGRWINRPETIDGKTYPPSTYDHGQTIPVTVADRDHPVTKGVSDYTIRDEAYGGVYVAPDVHVLLTADHPRSVKPIAWTHHYGKSLVVYFMAGHDADAWANPAFGKVLLNAIRWTADRS